MKKKIKPFIVVSHQRSGTTKLCNDILSSHHNVFSFDELLNQPNHKPTDNALSLFGLESFYSLRSKIEGRILGSENRYLRYHERFLKKMNEITHKEHIGFKLFKSQLPPIVYDKMISDKNNKIIVLKRRNLTKAAVSTYLLLNKGQRNSKDKQELKPYLMDIDWCAQWIAKSRLDIRYTIEKLSECKKDFFYVEYEELFNLDKINELFDFLGADPINSFPSGGLKKMSSDETYKKMINLNEFEESICNSYNGYLFDNKN